MKDKSKKKIMITIILLIIVIIGVLLMIKRINKNKISDVIEYNGEAKINNALERVSERSNYYIIKNIVEKYFLSLSDLNKTIDDIEIYEYEGDIQQIQKDLENQVEIEIENTKNKIYNLFSEDYIKETKISTNNLQEKLGNYNDIHVFIKDMYVRDLSGYLRMYFTFGTITEKEKLKTKDFKLMVLIDEKNKTYNIYTSDYIDKNNLYELSKDKFFKLGITEIKNRKFNTYKYENINDETYASDLLSHYTQSIKYSGIDYSYEKLNKEYKEKRFNRKSDYEEYVTENKKEIITALLDYYKVEKYNEYTQYICIDRQGNYYIFREKANMDYSLILDIYTVDLPGFAEKYKRASNEEKVMLNIQKVVEALNQEDYTYVYSKLADEFKANYFETYEEFKKYAEETFDIENEVTYNQFTESESYCTYKITLKGKEKRVTKTIVMRLDKGTDFAMSFNVE